MLYCFNAKHFNDNERTNKEIEYAISKKVFIYYDEEEQVFKDENENKIDVQKLNIYFFGINLKIRSFKPKGKKYWPDGSTLDLKWWIPEVIPPVIFLYLD